MTKVQSSAVIKRSNLSYYMALQRQQHNLNQTLNPQQTPQTSHWQASYGVFVMRILKKLTAL